MDDYRTPFSSLCVPRVLAQQEHSDAGQSEDTYARIYGEGSVHHQKCTAQYRRDHAAYARKRRGSSTCCPADFGAKYFWRPPVQYSPHRRRAQADAYRTRGHRELPIYHGEYDAEYCSHERAARKR